MLFILSITVNKEIAKNGKKRQENNKKKEKVKFQGIILKQLDKEQ